jgi:hypothetical protein
MPAQLVGRIENPNSDGQRDGADRAWQDEAGVEQLEDEPRDPDEEEDRDQVRVDQRVEEAGEEAGRDGADLRAGEVEREGALRVLCAVAVEPAKQRRQVRCDRVDHVHVQRLLCGQVGGLRDCENRPGGVALVRRSERAK